MSSSTQHSAGQPPGRCLALSSGAREAHLLHQRVLGQVLGQQSCRAGLALHAQGHGCEASQGQPAVEGPQDRPLSVLQLGKA